jgi:hypothetical protein
MPASSILSAVGIGKEAPATPGTAVPPTFWIPVHAGPKPLDKQAMLEDKGWRGSFTEDYDFVVGPYHTEYDYAGDVFTDAVGWPLAGVLGDVQVTGTTTTPTGTLSAASVVGATAVQSTVSFPSGTQIQVDAGNLAEIVTTTGVPTGAGPFTIPVPALKYAHAGPTPGPAAAITAVTTPYTHTFALLNSGTGQPPTYTVTDFYAVNTRQYPGYLFTDVAFKFAGDGLVTYTAKGMGYPSAVITKPVPSYSTERVIAGLTGTVQIGGTTTTILLSGDVNIKRTSHIIQPVNGIQAPRNIWGGKVTATGKMVLVMEDDSQLTNYLTNAQPGFDLNYSFGTGATARQFRLHCSRAVYKDANIVRGKDYVEIDVGFTAKATSLDVGPSGGYSQIVATVQNALPPGTYK